MEPPTRPRLECLRETGLILRCDRKVGNPFQTKQGLMLGGIGGRMRRGRQRMRWLDGITDSMDVGLGDPCLLCNRVRWRVFLCRWRVT